MIKTRGCERRDAGNRPSQVQIGMFDGQFDQVAARRSDRDRRHAATGRQIDRDSWIELLSRLLMTVVFQRRLGRRFTAGTLGVRLLRFVSTRATTRQPRGSNRVHGNRQQCDRRDKSLKHFHNTGILRGSRVQTSGAWLHEDPYRDSSVVRRDGQPNPADYQSQVAACSPAMTASRYSRARRARTSILSAFVGRGTSGAKMFS